MARRSIRSYAREPLSPSERGALEAAFADAGPGPFGNRPRFRLVAAAQVDAHPDRDARLGTYGVVSGAPAWLVGAVPVAPDALHDFGYAFEGVVLAATALGLGTCWLGGTFSRGAAARAVELRDGELLPAISPIGKPARRPTVIDAAFRFGAGSDGRKPWRELFFDGEPGVPLDPAGAGDWSAILEAVRRAPSASNRQPWRFVRDGPGRLRLLFAENRAYNRALDPVRIQEVDLGIAMRHLEAAVRATGRTGAWSRPAGDGERTRGDWSYVATWTGDA